MTVVLELKDFESFIDMERPPFNWEGAMEALVEGAVDYDEMEALADTCCDLAEAGLRLESLTSGTDYPQPWSGILPHTFRLLIEAQQSGEIYAELHTWFAGMGKAADKWLASQTT